MRRIPDSVIEAAGARASDIHKICSPQALQRALPIAILVFIDYWNMVEQPPTSLEDATMCSSLSITPGEIGLFCNGRFIPTSAGAISVF